MNSSIEEPNESISTLLSVRLSNISRLLFGTENDDDVDVSASKLNERVKNLTLKVDQIDYQIPILKNCRDLVKRFGPILPSKRGLSATEEVIEKCQLILTTKDALLHNILLLNEIRDALPVLNKPFNIDVNVAEKQLIELEGIITRLKFNIRQQTQDLDDFLLLYENTMQIYSQKIAEWDQILFELETDANITISG